MRYICLLLAGLVGCVGLSGQNKIGGIQGQSSVPNRAPAAVSPYISEVLEYLPAPGQFINSTNGTPESAKSIVGGVTGLLSLGAFGGSAVFKFEVPVANDPDHPYGVDFTIFGNPSATWSEPGIVWVMKDENDNGLPDDTWYELAGSNYFFSSTVRNYQVTYFNPKEATAADVPWTDNQGQSGVVLEKSFHQQPYYPSFELFPTINADLYTLIGTGISDAVDLSNPTFVMSYPLAFGYADNRQRGQIPYTLPDNPYTLEKENAGGDAFDISWAVNEAGEYVDLDVIDFVKVQNAVLADGGWLGEVSTEIAGACLVEPNADIKGPEDMVVVKRLPATIVGDHFPLEAVVFHRGRRVKEASIVWSSNLADARVEDNMLLFSGSGDLTLTATLQDNPEIMASVATSLVFKDGATSVSSPTLSEALVYPSPASDFITVRGVMEASVSIYNLSGALVKAVSNYSGDRSISVGALSPGVYVLKVTSGGDIKTFRFLKQ